MINHTTGLGPIEKTIRGWPIIKFKDYYDAKCSLQVSSIILDDEGLENPGTGCIWLGVDDADPHVMASKAEQFGVKTSKTTGWVPYPIPDGVLLTTRMHLNRQQATALIGHLQKWLDTGTL